MNTSTTLDSLSTGVSAAVAEALGSTGLLSINTQGMHRTFMVTGIDTKPSPLSRYRVHVIAQRDKMTGTAIYTDYGVNNRGTATSSKETIDLTELQSLITSISQFLLTGK
ncbi:MAG: hypothetical protein P4L77_11485 [Sulfuriferula sp.]|nr:hypothetical protein [Sulfuriferula sp.]